MYIIRQIDHEYKYVTRLPCIGLKGVSPLNTLVYSVPIYHQFVHLDRKLRKMTFSNILLQLSILPVLSAVTLWQNSTECTDAVSEFSQQSTCFGSAAGKKAWQETMFTMNESTFASHLVLHHSPGSAQGLISFYNSFCISQMCVNLYANVVEKCFAHVQEKV